MEHVEEQEMIAHRKQFVIWAGVFQIILLVLFSMCTQYGDSAVVNKIIEVSTQVVKGVNYEVLLVSVWKLFYVFN